MTAATEAIEVELTGGALRNSYVSLRDQLSFFPSDAIGGETDAEPGQPIVMHFDGDRETVETDINGPKLRFRNRAMWRHFFAHQGANVGDRVRIARVGDRTYHASLVRGQRSSTDQANAADPLVRQIPTFHFSYAHRLLAAVAERGRVSLQELFEAVDVEELFKGDRPHKAPLDRARQFVRFARDLDVLAGDGDQLELTESGTRYVLAGDSEDVFGTTPAQAAILREQIELGAGRPSIARGALLALSLVASASAPLDDEDLGRALSILGGVDQWREPKTYESQGGRFRALLEDAGLVTPDRVVTDVGRLLLDRAAVLPHDPLHELAALSRRRQARPESPVSASSVRVWLVRAGRHGAYEQLALDEDVCLIGWSDLGPIPTEMSRDELKKRVDETWPGNKPQSVAAQAGQIYRFVHDLKIGDLVLLPLLSKRGRVAVARIAGEYAYRNDGAFADTDAQQTRPVEWLAEDLPYDRFDPDLREAFGQQGTVSEISKPNAAQRVLDVLRGADASAIHLVLKWSPTQRPDTIERHREVAQRDGAVWWGRTGSPGATGLGAEWVDKLRQQLDRGTATTVFLHSPSATTWRTRLLEVALDEAEVEPDLVPDYYSADQHHTLWVKLADFEEADARELTDDFVLARSGDPVTLGGLGNQTPLIVRARSSAAPGRFFLIKQGPAEEAKYEDREGEQYHWTNRSSGAWKQLANSPGAGVLYYRSGSAPDGQTYFAQARLGEIRSEEREDGLVHFVADIEDFERFDPPVPARDGPIRVSQPSILPLTRTQFEKVLALRSGGEARVEFTLEAVREAAEDRGLSLAPEIYAQLFAALESGKHVILTGPPGTAKTTLAQAVAEAAHDARLCDGYVLTTATADWTTYETIGGLRPTENNELQFEEGHFLDAIRRNRWLVIDELNRSNFDRAFGQLFTVLSGQPVVLPFHRPETKPRKPLALVPEGAAAPAGEVDILEIPQGWRIVATMNVFDKTLLFEMSFALMRRFAFIEVASPSLQVFEALTEQAASGHARAGDLAKRLLALRDLQDLGPAVFMDLARYLRARLVEEDADDGQLLFEAFYSYLLPQFEGIDSAAGDQLFARVSKLVGATRKERLRRTLNTVLGLELAGKALAADAGDDDNYEADDDALELDELIEPSG